MIGQIVFIIESSKSSVKAGWELFTSAKICILAAGWQ